MTPRSTLESDFRSIQVMDNLEIFKLFIEHHPLSATVGSELLVSHGVWNKLPGWVVKYLQREVGSNVPYIGGRRPSDSADFFFWLLSSDQSRFPNRIHVWDRLCTHFESVKVMTFCICHLTFLKSEHSGPLWEKEKHKNIFTHTWKGFHQEMGDYYRDVKGGREQ